MKNQLKWLFAILITPLFSHTGSSMAAWSAYAQFGSTTVVTSDASCASRAAGEVICVVRNLANQFVVNRFNGTAWGAAQPIMNASPVTMISDPSCSDDGLAKVLCVAINANSGFVYTLFNGATWSFPANLAGQFASKPSCASFAAGKVVCVARNGAGGLTSAIFDGAAWSLPAAIAGTAAKISSPPSCAADGAGSVICAALTFVNRATLAFRFNGTSWSAPLNIAGTSNGEQLNCTKTGLPGQVSCFARGTNNAIFTRRFNGGTFSLTNWTPTWASLGSSNTAYSNASCASIAPGQLICGAIAVTDAVLYVARFDGVAWLGWTKVGTATGVRNPNCTTLSANKALCTIVNSANKVISTVGP